MKRIAGIFLLALGLVVMCVALINVFGQQTEKRVELTTSPVDTHYAMTAPGVLGLVDPTVDVTITADGEVISWGIGATDDVMAYIGDASRTAIAGLKTWENFDLTTLAGTAEANDAIAKLGAQGKAGLESSDLWVKSGTGNDKVTFTFKANSKSAQSLIVTTASGKAPVITLGWNHRIQRTNPIPLLAIGILLALVGAFFMLEDLQQRAAKRRKAERRKARERRLSEHQTLSTTVLPRYEGDLSDPDTEREVQRTYTDNALGASILPGTTRTQALRNRELAEEDRVVLPIADDGGDEYTENEVDAAKQDGIVTEISSVAEEHKESNDEREPRVEDEPHDEPQSHSDHAIETVVGENIESDNTQKPSDWNSLWDFSWGQNDSKEEDNA